MNGFLFLDCKFNNVNDLWYELMILFFCIICFQILMNVGIYFVYSCVEIFWVYFFVFVDQDLSFSQIRLYVKVNKKIFCVNKKLDG